MFVILLRVRNLVVLRIGARQRARGAQVAGLSEGTAYNGVTLNVARPDMNNYATLGVMLY